MYGGKIDNEYDMKILESLVNLYFNEKTFSDNYIIFESERKIKEYYFYNDKLIYEREFSKGNKKGNGARGHPEL